MAPKQKDVKELVAAGLDDLKITRAVIIDDAFAPGVSPTDWVLLVEYARAEAPSLYEKIVAEVAKTTGNVDAYPDDLAVREIERLVVLSKDVTAVSLMTAPPRAEPALRLLEGYLRELNITPLRHWRLDATVPRDEKLYFIDYRLQPEQPDTAGKDASALLGELIGQVWARENGEPPAAILMSRSVADRPGEAQWEMVAREGGGYLRSNFRYMEKSTLDARSQFMFLLYDLVTSLPMGQAYFDHVRGLRKAARKTVDRVASETCGLLPADFNPFAARLTGGDTQQRAKLADHLLGLFSGLLSAELRNDGDVRASLEQFMDTLEKAQMMVPEGLGSHSLHRIHSKLLYDQSNYALNSPIGFGDIYTLLGDGENYFLVITPECDLELRHEDGKIAPKVCTILLLNGKIQTTRPPSSAGNLVATPLMLDPEGKLSWLCWSLQTPSLVPWMELAPGARYFKKWGRLRTQEAEKVQMRYAADLLSVGTDDVSSHLRMRKAELYHVPDKKTFDKLGVCDVMENDNAKADDGPLWALGVGSEKLFCSETNNILPPRVLGELRCYLSKPEFRAKLKEFKVGIREDRETIYLTWFSGTYVKPEGLIPPAPKTETPTAEKDEEPPREAIGTSTPPAASRPCDDNGSNASSRGNPPPLAGGSPPIPSDAL